MDEDRVLLFRGLSSMNHVAEFTPQRDRMVDVSQLFDSFVNDKQTGHGAVKRVRTRRCIPLPPSGHRMHTLDYAERAVGATTYTDVMPEVPRIHVYVDETGDRGQSADSSPVFGMAALLVSDEGASPLRRAIEQLRSDFGVPEGRIMSWKNDLKNHDRRRRAAEVLGSVPGIKVCYVYAAKNELHPTSYKSDPTRFYNYVAMRTYRSILWAARDWKGTAAQVWTRFGHVRRHDHTVTKKYIESQAAKDGRIPHLMEQGLTWVSADMFIESQAADIFGGFLKSATWPEKPYGYTEPANLKGRCGTKSGIVRAASSRSASSRCPAIAWPPTRIGTRAGSAHGKA